MVTNTIPEKLHAVKKEMDNKGRMGMDRAIIRFRNEVVDSTNFPRVSGRYVGSLSLGSQENVKEIQQESQSITGIFGSKVVYAARVEFGFVGEDSLGRKYNQAGQYNLTRGLDQAMPDIKLILQKAMML